MRANGWRTLGVVSARGNPGRTLLACNLAVGLAQEEDLTALLVDADLRAPSIADLFQLPPGAGFGGVVTGRASLEDALVHASIGEPGPELVILAGGQPVVGAAELMGSPSVAGLVREIAERYQDRMVVFDLPPVLAGADALAFLPNVDATLLVVEEYGTTYEDLEQAQELLGAFNLLGVVLDKASDVAINREHGRRRGLLARLVSRIGL
jgi:protein-tyrosine kinase